jgi:hypothetical protein
MSRNQSSQIEQTATAQNATDFANQQANTTAANTDLGQVNSDIAGETKTANQIAASDPYSAGGEYATTIGQQLSNTADADSASETNALQSQAQRTGQNAAGANASAEEISQNNERTLADQGATAEQNRIASEAGYQQQNLSNQGTITGQQGSVANQEANMAQGEGGNANAAMGQANTASANNQSFWDQFTKSFAPALGNLATAGLGGAAGGVLSGNGAGAGAATALGA